MQGAAAMASGVSEDQVAVCSTGVIGVQLDGRAVVKGLAQAARELRAGRRRRLPGRDRDDRPLLQAREPERRARPAAR